jgi:hypothetical protein
MLTAGMPKSPIQYHADKAIVRPGSTLVRDEIRESKHFLYQDSRNDYFPSSRPSRVPSGLLYVLVAVELQYNDFESSPTRPPTTAA